MRRIQIHILNYLDDDVCIIRFLKLSSHSLIRQPFSIIQTPPFYEKGKNTLSSINDLPGHMTTHSALTFCQARNSVLTYANISLLLTQFPTPPQNFKTLSTCADSRYPFDLYQTETRRKRYFSK